MTRPEPLYVAEDVIKERFNTPELLKSGGDYGAGAVVFEGDLVEAPGERLFSDEWVYAMHVKHPDDLGTVVVTGSVRAESEIFISDRLMCLVVLGAFEAPALSIFATEVYVGGDLTTGDLTDTDDLLTVRGTRTVGAA